MKKIKSLQAIIDEKSTTTVYQDIPANKNINKDKNTEKEAEEGGEEQNEC